MTKRILRSILLVAVLVLAASTGATLGILYYHFGGQLEEELRREASYLSVSVEKEGIEAFDDLPADAERVTYIDTDGTVLFDNRADENGMENHGDREEVKEALEQGSGRAVRNSDTLSQRTLYYALRLSDGKVLRVSSTQYNIPGLMGGMIQPLLIILILMAALSAWIAYRVSRGIVEPINRLDLDHPEDNQVYDEIAPLLTKINRQQKQIRREIADAKRQQEEFSIITENMEEGFVILDVHTEVLSYNSSALKLLGAEESRERRSILAMNRSQEFQRIVEQVLSGRHVITMLELGDRSCQIAANPVFHDNEVSGAVLLILDVTERMKGEQMRREFTANVSHELKTPLTSIIGYADMLRTVECTKEETFEAVNYIFQQGKRLESLSFKLLELIVTGKQEYDFRPLGAEEFIQDAVRLTETGRKEKEICLTAHIEKGTVIGDRDLLVSMLTNFLDNARKAVSEHGQIRIRGRNQAGGYLLSISDNGCGMEEKELTRITEAFYMVDKSRARKEGGAGLGMTLCSRILDLHGARWKISSIPGKGTSIALWFPGRKEGSGE